MLYNNVKYLSGEVRKKSYFLEKTGENKANKLFFPFFVYGKNGGFYVFKAVIL